ncbi:MAG TPA: hypothetical protein VHW67_14255, partial [Solirubrobacteraceae bacterium]|nr:hypothetical protein [Solirubrobacteraceae bacterium]
SRGRCTETLPSSGQMHHVGRERVVIDGDVAGAGGDGGAGGAEFVHRTTGWRAAEPAAPLATVNFDKR